jgi:HEPN domain-containing protein
MSVDKQAYEASRWLETAEEDLEAARVLLREEKHSHACFLAQQSGEKAVKALRPPDNVGWFCC